MNQTQIDQELIKSALQEIGLRNAHIFEVQNRVFALTGWKTEQDTEGNQLVVTIAQYEGLNLSSVQVLGTLFAPPESTPSEHLCQLLMAISYLNYRLSVVKIGYDPRDGEVRFSVEAPLILGEKIKECIQETVKVAIVAVDKYKSDLIRIRDGQMSFDEFYKKQGSEKSDTELGEEVPEPEQRRILAGLLRSLAELIETTAEQSEESEKSEQS